MFFRWAASILGTVFLAGTLSAQSNMMSAKSEWRGTLLDGTNAIIATNKYGEPTFVKTETEVAEQFAPMSLAGDKLADEFKLLCLDTEFDQTLLEEAVGQSSISWIQREFVVDAVKQKWGQFHSELWTSAAARVQIWNGPNEALKNTQVISRWRKGMTVTVFSPKRILSPSCGLTVMTTDTNSPAAFLERLEFHLGVAPKKVVTKEKWADGHWMIDDKDGSSMRVGYSMTDLDKGEQLLHVSVASIASKKKR